MCLAVPPVTSRFPWKEPLARLLTRLIIFACVCSRCKKSHRVPLCLLLWQHLTFVGAVRASARSGDLLSLLSSCSLMSHSLLRRQSHPWVSSWPCKLRVPCVHVAGAELKLLQTQKEVYLVEELLLEWRRDAQVPVLGKIDLGFLISYVWNMIKYFFSDLTLSVSLQELREKSGILLTSDD